MTSSPGQRDPSGRVERIQSVLWGVAIIGIVISIVVSVLTPYKLFFLFVPILLGPACLRRRDGR